MLQISDLRTPLFGPLSLSVAAGECVSIAGKSGTGKSLFLRAIVDLDPNEGEVSLNGQLRSQMPAWQWRTMVMLVPAQSGWWDDRVGDHFPADAGQREPLTGLLEKLGLPQGVLTWRVSRLSTGEKQRLSLARSLLLQPKALLLDEPTASLDPATTQAVEDLIRQQITKGVAVILVTHDPAQAERLADRQLELQAGKLVPLNKLHVKSAGKPQRGAK